MQRPPKRHVTSSPECQLPEDKAAQDTGSSRYAYRPFHDANRGSVRVPGHCQNPFETELNKCEVDHGFGRLRREASTLMARGHGVVEAKLGRAEARIRVRHLVVR